MSAPYQNTIPMGVVQACIVYVYYTRKYMYGHHINGFFPLFFPKHALKTEPRVNLNKFKTRYSRGKKIYNFP